MSAPVRLFEGASHARLYLKFRPVVPSEVFRRTLEYLKEKPFKLAVDVGCGSGQTTRPLAPHFEKVIGVDVSEAQIAAARQTDNPSNVEYRLGQGERIPVPDSSVSLVTCGQAAHWLAYDEFCREVDRVLHPSGCVSIFTYGNFALETCHGDAATDGKLQQLHKQFHKETLGPYWDKRRRHVDDMYANISIPYAENTRDDSLEMVQEMSVASYVGFLSSWSSYRAFREKNPDAPDPLKDLQERVMQILNAGATAEDTLIRMRGPIALLLGRKPANPPP